MSNNLPSWNDGKTKERILNYVRVGDRSQSGCIRAGQRSDCHLRQRWLLLERETSLHPALFLLARLKQMATDDPTLRDKPHFRAAYEGDHGLLCRLDHTPRCQQLLQVVFDSHAGMPRLSLKPW